MSQKSPVKDTVTTVLMHFDDHIREGDNYVNATEWINGEGVDVVFGDGQTISLSHSQYRALREVVNKNFIRE